ncbi:MAG: glycosyltransferase family 4 protein, partial [Mariprofundaceae bacterium]|nr:glycosyltransferase family 4 protein [Mariprofundaceae bacterium]
MKPMRILQICRRFGPVGGMERYVWELCRELAALGHHIEVLCEVDLSSEPLHGVDVYSLGTVRPRPRWLAHLRFSRHVHDWLDQHADSSRIIHSHERCDIHHVTTFHGPPFASVKDRPFWKRLSVRIEMNLWLEQRELCAEHVQQIVPNSAYIRQQLAHYYPESEQRLSSPIAPGVSPVQVREKNKLVLENAGVIGFIGKEWKRKGLQEAIAMLAKLSEKRPNIRFLVAGAAPKDIQHLFQDVDFKFELLGRVDPYSFYAQLDVLLHPAHQEPYGMVITEALSAGVPVIISDRCGAATEIHADLGQVLSLDDSVNDWADAMDEQLKGNYEAIAYQR